MCSFGLVRDVNVELDGNTLRRKAGIVAAGLVSQLSVDREVSRTCCLRSAHLGRDGEIVGVDVQFLARIEREAQILSRGINDASRGQICRRLKLESCGNQKFRFGLIRIDVKAFFDFEVKLDVCGFSRSDCGWRSAFKADVNAGRVGAEERGRNEGEYEKDSFH